MASGDSMCRLWETTNGAEVLTIPLKDAARTARNWCSLQPRRPSDLGRADEQGQPWGWDATPLERRGGRTMSEVTRLLEAANRGDRQAAADLLPMVYDELRKLAAARLAREKPGPDARRDGAGARGISAAGRRANVRRATAISSPRPPRRSGASSSSRPAAARPSSAAATETGKNSIPTASRPLPPMTSSSPSTRPSIASLKLIRRKPNWSSSATSPV